MTEKFATVWDAIAATPEEAANLKIRADLMIALNSFIKAQGWTQSEAARKLGISQPRVSDLKRGKISLFSVDTLIELATAAGLQIELKVNRAA